MDILVVIVMVMASFTLGAIISKQVANYSWARWVDRQFRPAGSIVHNCKDENSLYLEWEADVDVDKVLSGTFVTFYVREINNHLNDR